MLPIRDHNPTHRRPVVVRWLVGINAAVFVLSLFEPALPFHLALYPRRLMAGQIGPGLLTHMFVHAGFLHLAGNLLFLWIFGDNIEDRLGHFGFLAFYLACGIVAAGAHVAMRPESPVPMVGASGAIAGVMGAYLLLFPRARVDVIAGLGFIFARLAVPAWFVLIIWAGLQIVMGAFDQGIGGVAHDAHIGGFVAGLMLALPARLNRPRLRRQQVAGQGRNDLTPTRIPKIPPRQPR